MAAACKSSRSTHAICYLHALTLHIHSHARSTQIFQIHTRAMACERDIRFELLARLCPNSTGADIRRWANSTNSLCMSYFVCCVSVR